MYGFDTGSPVAKHADNDALIVKHQDVKWTYRELAERVNVMAQKLLDMGIGRGDRVGKAFLLQHPCEPVHTTPYNADTIQYNTCTALHFTSHTLLLNQTLCYV